MIHATRLQAQERAAAAALRESEERFRRISAITTGIAYACATRDDGQYAIVWITGAVERITGYSSAEIMAQGCWGCLVVESDSALFSQHVLGLVPGTQGACELRFRHRDGHLVWIASFAECVADPQSPGQHRLYGGLTDITERKQAEADIQTAHRDLQRLLVEAEQSRRVLLSLAEDQKEAEDQIRQLNRELEQRVLERTAELKAANTELNVANAALVRANRLKDEFLATMSHELRTPLTGVLGLSEALQMGIYGPLTEKQQHALGSVRESGQHLLGLITDILDLSKLEADRLELQLGPVVVSEACQASLLFVKQLAQKKALRVSLSLDYRVDRLEADPRRLKQMLVNLLGNAVKFTSAGGELGLRVEGDIARQVVHFVVWDTGIGIAPEDQARLFQPFVQLDSRLAREYEGTGLGLALVRRMAALHGGQVTVESDGVPGHGSRFTLTLPWRRQAAEAQANPAAPGGTPGRGTGQLILVVEDNELCLTTLSDVLRAQGYRVEAARQGVEALALTQALRPALLLLDIQMPGMDGLEVIRQLRASADRHLAATPILALTALVMPGDREQCLAAGANGYLSKPVNLGELIQTVGQCLGVKEP